MSGVTHGAPMSKHERTTTNIAEHLKRIVSPWPEVLSQRDIDFRTPAGQLIASCISLGFEAVLDGYPGTYTWKQLQEI
ncbi:hypothetical protein CLAFUW4_13514 [Fulvia fulva]|uniref:Uncharacterized protein n=1 Tax=Passalora fulva TaxID=5499 RepID=A0A9Q8PL95_PASFU|nr:uncharacterized protein CLAFUR5_13365 [Fulvia fulva]KAK4610072.1 hypothetical protein CLAFUR4_13516 [Fulvia fulva]KAK4611372.1 hypothetical protein CLAFUR0_13525 [Fulvia fulva]UJO24689.1 hypothetical protein CLAFUR5_13365 [Fulvia fulva]WPV22042.1 hypothetical protein CLAFUW4_13514 [Fulvia fulva]WPV36867.1 hypothetical protein CLAFUW7_13521 [Fulvia fulva]